MTSEFLFWILTDVKDWDFSKIFQGYVIVEDFFTSEELEPVKGAINRLVDDLAHKLYKAGKIPSKFVSVEQVSK